MAAKSIKNRRYLPPEKSLVLPTISSMVKAIKRNLLHPINFSSFAREKMVLYFTVIKIRNKTIPRNPEVRNTATKIL
jgi:hypothetical protein